MFKIIGFICAALLICALFGGYFALRREQVRQAAVVRIPQSEQEPIPPPAKMQVFEDEAFLKKGEAVIGGTVQNISDVQMEQLSVTLKLMRRGGGEELKTIPLTPSALAPGEQASYTLRVPAGAWSGAKAVRVGSFADDIAYEFKSSRGKERPREVLQTPVQRTIIVQRPKSRQRGEEFLNTPDNPVIIK